MAEGGYTTGQGGNESTAMSAQAAVNGAGSGNTNGVSSAQQAANNYAQANAAANARSSAAAAYNARVNEEAAAQQAEQARRAAASALVKNNLTKFDENASNFYAFARGRLLNKYQVAFNGPYVEEALRVLDQNSYGDKYNKNPKLYAGVPFRHETFKQWLAINYDIDRQVLFMNWSAQNVKLPSAGAGTGRFNIDTVKTSMPYPLITKPADTEPLTMTIVDDAYGMWFNFFNALFNVQFSPLVLKARSTWQKIQIFVDVYQEATTRGEGLLGANDLGTDTITGMMRSQMWEFNSCVLKKAPPMELSHNAQNLYTFNVSFEYPNAFQGTCKEEFRYLRDNTSNANATDDSKNANGQKSILDGGKHGRYNASFFEETYEDIQKAKKEYRYEALQKNSYNKFSHKAPGLTNI